MTQTLPSIRNADLPRLYTKARDTLAACAKVDECKTWSDKAKAMASYAKQSQDRTLYRYASRIALRATQRCGELLRQVPSARGGDRHGGSMGGRAPIDSRTAAGRAAGLSRGQVRTALRVANVPREMFEERTESANPPTVTQMARLGTRSAPPSTPRPPRFAETTQAIGALRELARRIGDVTPRQAARALLPNEKSEVKRTAKRAGDWLADFLMATEEN